MSQQEQRPSGEEDLSALRSAIDAGDAEAADEALQELGPGESARAITRLPDEEQVQLLTVLPEEDAAHLLEAVPEPHAAQLVGQLETGEAASILNEVPSDEQADILLRLPPDRAEAILDRMEPEEAADARRLMRYPADTAGGLMVTEYLAYPVDETVEDVLRDLRANAQRYREYDVQYAYVVDEAGRLVGVLPMRDLLLADRDAPVESLMVRDPLRVDDSTPLEDLERFFDQHPLFGVPAVDPQGRLRGVVRRQDVEEAAEERSSRTMLRFTGILGGEELRTMPLRLRSLRRLSWLSINIVLNLAAASVIAAYQDTLARAIALAIFLPIISDMSGCSGNQAVAVSMRELSLSLIRPRELARVLAKEAAVGLVNGIALGLILGVVAGLWQGNATLAMVVAVALAVNTVLAACLGGGVPLLLKGLGQDPALASGPILTTITDMCGFFLVLSLASWLLV